MLTVTRDDGFVISADPGRIDVDRVHHWLSTDTYWATGRPRELVERSIGNSRTYGVYRSDGEQVAVARVVTDEATFAWLCDVYVDRAVRGRGLARWLVEAIRDDLEAVGVRRILLGPGTRTVSTRRSASRPWTDRTGGWSTTGVLPSDSAGVCSVLTAGLIWPQPSWQSGELSTGRGLRAAFVDRSR